MLPDINLLPKYERERSLLYILFIIGLILAVLIMGFFAYQYITVSDEMKQAEAHNEQLTATKETLNLEIKQQEPIEEASMEEAVDYAEEYVVPTSKLIDQLTTFLPSTGFLSKYNYEDGEVVVETHFETMTDASAYIDKLNTSEYIREAKVNKIETFELEPPSPNSEEQAKNAPSAIQMSPFQLLPRYQVAYSFAINADSLKKENEENE